MFMYQDQSGQRMVLMICPLSLHGTAPITALVTNNGNQTTASQNVTVDETAPAVTISVGNTNLTASSPTTTVTFTFTEAPVTFSSSDLGATGGSISGLQQISATVWTATYTANTSIQTTTASVAVTAGSYQDTGLSL